MVSALLTSQDESHCLACIQYIRAAEHLLWLALICWCEVVDTLWWYVCVVKVSDHTQQSLHYRSERQQ